MNEILYTEKTLINKIPIKFDRSEILLEEELIETFTSKQKTISYDFDIERVTSKPGRFFPENKKPYLSGVLKEIAKTLGCDKSIVKKKDLIECIHEKYYGK